MIHLPLRDQDRSLWCLGWWNHQVPQVFWWKEAYEVIEVTEVLEAVEVIETAEVPVARKITQYVKWKQFLIFFEAKKAVEVIEASDVIKFDEVIEATEVSHARKSLSR